MVSMYLPSTAASSQPCCGAHLDTCPVSENCPRSGVGLAFAPRRPTSCRLSDPLPIARTSISRQVTKVWASRLRLGQRNWWATWYWGGSPPSRGVHICPLGATSPMPETITVSINGSPVRVSAGISVAAAILISGTVSFRRSISGEPRAPLCGMGICFECRVTIDGLEHCLSCQTLCRDGMEVRTA
jgi:D-hydroxyproline dehydrogenase subunit gamma